MKVTTLRVKGIRCFEDTGSLELSSTCNIFVGENNSGKSTVLGAMLAFQGIQFNQADVRHGVNTAFVAIEMVGDPRKVQWVHGVAIQNHRIARPYMQYAGASDWSNDSAWTRFGINQLTFHNARPNHYIVPYRARRKAVAFNHTVNTSTSQQLDGTLTNVYARIDKIVSGSTSRSRRFHAVVEKIIGVPITTQMSSGGKVAGFEFYDGVENSFVDLERMGDGVSEVVSLVADLCSESGKLFVIEEPETNLHPGALKALMGLIRESWDQNDNQFIIATHSNIVLRELGSDDRTHVFRVARPERDPRLPSTVSLVPKEFGERARLLRELGYEFADMDLHDGWLFLEESSAEQVIREILIPKFAPKLIGRLRTCSAAGVDKIDPILTDFERLIKFVHLEPVYRDRMWVVADGDTAGIAVIDGIKTKFNYLNDKNCLCFQEPAFEKYYPARFQEQTGAALSISNKREKREEKARLLREVLEWTRQNEAEAFQAWNESAAEIIGILKNIEKNFEQR